MESAADFVHLPRAYVESRPRYFSDGRCGPNRCLRVGGTAHFVSEVPDLSPPRPRILSLRPGWTTRLTRLLSPAMTARFFASVACSTVALNAQPTVDWTFTLPVAGTGGAAAQTQWPGLRFPQRPAFRRRPTRRILGDQCKTEHAPNLNAGPVMIGGGGCTAAHPPGSHWHAQRIAPRTAGLSESPIP